jgi:hypothetical protein
MKKTLFVLMVSLVSSNSSAFEDLQSTPKTELPRCESCFLDVDNKQTDKYTQQLSERQEQDLDEYDQNVTDNVKPPKVSNAQAMFKEIMGSLLVRCIALRELAQVYFKEFKETFARWYHNIIKA